MNAFSLESFTTNNSFFISVEKTQDTLEEQERQRLETLRQRDRDRARRFIDAKSRSIGIDKEYLDKQVEEKRLREVKEKEEKLREGKL